MTRTPRLLFLAFGFPPAAKSSSYRLLEIANQFASLGWSVTVLNAADAVWEADTGIDASLSARVAAGVEVIQVDVDRPDLETDIRRYSRARALKPVKWLREYRKESQADFPEPVHGAWRRQLEQQVLGLHDQDPFDLLVVSCVPYVLLAPALRLHRERGVPFVVDFRDGWSIDVVGGAVAFDEDSEAGQWESSVLGAARELWVVNEPIADHYRSRYPALAEKVRVVRNGFDDPEAWARIPDTPSSPPLRFGYLGTVNFSAAALEGVLRAWREARNSDPDLRDATLEFRGYFGAGPRRQAHPHLELLAEYADDGVSYGGPVAKADVVDAYASWDALVLILIGGGFVTSGKVYEYMASGLPVVSAHEEVHDAATLLSTYPLWVGNTGLEHPRLVRAFGEAARLALATGPEGRRQAKEQAAAYRRGELMAPAVRSVAEGVI